MNNNVDELDEILLGLSTSKTSYDKPDGRRILTDIYLDEAKAKLNTLIEQRVIDELSRLLDYDSAKVHKYIEPRIEELQAQQDKESDA